MMIYDQTTLLNALLNAYTQHFLIIGWPPQFDLYSFSHTDINRYDLDVTGGWIHAYLFGGSISTEDPCSLHNTFCLRDYIKATPVR